MKKLNKLTKIIILVCTVSITFLMQKSFAQIGIDSVHVYPDTNTVSVIVKSHGNVNYDLTCEVATDPAFTMNYQIDDSLTLVPNTSTDVFDFVGLVDGTLYYLRVATISDTVLSTFTTIAIPLPPFVSNLQITNVIQTGGMVSADYNTNGAPMLMIFMYSYDSINWVQYTTYALTSGSGNKSFFFALPPGNTAYFYAVGNTDTTSVGVLITPPIPADPPHIIAMAFSSITQTSAVDSFSYAADSVLTSLITVRSSLDPTFVNGVTNDTSMLVSPGIGTFGVLIGGYMAGQHVYVEVAIWNTLGADTLVSSFTTLPPTTIPPDVLNASVGNVLEHSGFVGFSLLVDSTTLNMLNVASSLDPTFSSFVYGEYTSNPSFSTTTYNIHIDGDSSIGNGYNGGQTVWVRITVWNSYGVDTVYLSFVTNTGSVFGPPTASMNAVINITQSSGELFANYTIGGSPYAMYGFQAAYAGDTNVLFWYSTPAIDTVYNQSGVLHATVTGLPPNTAVACQFFIFTPNTGIVFTPFVFFTTLGFTGVNELGYDNFGFQIIENEIILNSYTKDDMEIYTIDGKLVTRNGIEREENRINISNLSSGVYVVRSGKLIKKFFH